MRSLPQHQCNLTQAIAFGTSEADRTLLSSMCDRFRLLLRAIAFLYIWYMRALPQHQCNLTQAIALYYRQCAIARLRNSQYAIAPLTSMQSETSDAQQRW